MAIQYRIFDGPSKFDFMLALFDGDSDHRRIVRFTLLNPENYIGGQQPPTSLSCVINGVEREDGSGECWIFKGAYHRELIDDEPVHGFFSTRTRKGWVEFYAGER